MSTNSSMNPIQADLDFGIVTKSSNLEVSDSFMEDRESNKFVRPSKALMDSRENSILSDRLNNSRSFYIPDIKERMWTKDYIGLYCHYAAVGFVGGVQGILLNFCVYYFNGADNLCPNAQSIVFLPWSFKVFYAMITDSFRPFGLRRKPYMIAGWVGVLSMLLILAAFSTVLGSMGWILVSIASMFFLMIADVPADGYCVEIGQVELPHLRGQVLATGQRIRFTCMILAGFIQALLVNGPTTNAEHCKISITDCWSWGLTAGEYYGLIFAICAVLFIPILFLKELDSSHIPQRTFNEHRLDLWGTLQNLTTLYLLIFVFGANTFSTLANIAAVYLQYYVIELTNFQSGIDAITMFLALVVAIWIFQTFLINRNWRYSQYGSNIFTAILGLQWLLAFYNVGGLRNGWFTIFINMNQQFSAGITQVLYAMAVIELAKPGQEAITYELIVSAANAAININTILGTQFLQFTKASPCQPTDDAVDDGVHSCPENSVDVVGVEGYLATDGPNRFAQYTYMLLAINIVGTVIFTRFLPRQKEECHEWRKRGEAMGQSRMLGYISIFFASSVIGYGILASIMLIDVKTACIPAFGGDGC